ncbi:hypothetical protein V6N13_038270 [Hibiscus sabdariffa]
MAAPSPTTVSLKLLIAPKSQRVLYAEAGKDFVDFLFNIMTLPVGTVSIRVNPPGKVGEGFVKEAVTYMITDDLVVRPIATSSIVTLFNKYKIKDVGDLEEKVIAVGVNESKTALTDVFLKKKPGESDIGNSGGIHSTVL